MEEIKIKIEHKDIESAINYKQTGKFLPQAGTCCPAYFALIRLWPKESEGLIVYVFSATSKFRYWKWGTRNKLSQHIEYFDSKLSWPRQRNYTIETNKFNLLLNENKRID